VSVGSFLSRERIILAVLAMTGLSFIIKYLILNRYLLPPGNDAPMYMIMGKTFLEGKPLVAGYPPLVPLIFFFGGIPIAKVYGPLMSSLLGMVTYLILNELTHNKLIALIGCAIGAVGSVFYAYESSLAWGNNAMLTSLVLGMLLYWLFIRFSHAEARLYHFVICLVISFLLGLTHILAFIFYFVMIINLMFAGIKKARFALKGFLVFILPGLSALPFIINSAGETVENPSVRSNTLNVSGFGSINPSYSLLDIVFDIMILSLAVVGTYVLYRFYKPNSKILISGFGIPILLALSLQILQFPTFYARFLDFSIPPLIVLSSLSIGYFSASFLKKSKKQVAVALLVVILLTALTWSIMIYRLSSRVENDALIRASEYEAIRWLTENTGSDSKIAATFPLGAWIEVLTGRKVISGFHQADAITTREPLRIYRDVEIMQLANYYRELGFFRVYEMSPLSGTLSPLISTYSYDRGKFINVLWVDEGLSYVNGRPLNQSLTKWQLSPDGTYVVEGEDATKQLSIQMKKVSISYNFTNPSKFQLTFFFNPEVAYRQEDAAILGPKIVVERLAPIVVEARNATIIWYFRDATKGLLGIRIEYKSIKSVRIEVYTTSSEPIPNNDFTASRQQTMAAYNIDYIVVYKDGLESAWAVSMLKRADKAVFENRDVAIFKVESSQ